MSRKLSSNDTHIDVQTALQEVKICRNALPSEPGGICPVTIGQAIWAWTMPGPPLQDAWNGLRRMAY